MCSACAGNYENPEMTAAAGSVGTGAQDERCAEIAPGRGLVRGVSPRARGGIPSNSEREARAGNRTLASVARLEIRVGPATITEVYAEPARAAVTGQESEVAMNWEEGIRKRYWRAARRRSLYRWLAGVAMGAAAMAAVVWLLRG